MSLVVPESAVTEVADDSYVFLAAADGTAGKISVKIGARRFGYVEITEGLKDGDMVITEGSFKIREGQPVRIQTVKPDSGANGNTGLVVESADAHGPE